MGLRRALIFFSLAASLLAAPKLRLMNTTVGPISIAAGASGPTQTVEAFNAGDIPIQIALQTPLLAKGMYTGTVTVNDPNAVDSNKVQIAVQ